MSLCDCANRTVGMLIRSFPLRQTQNRSDGVPDKTDLLFSAVNVSRFVKVDTEEALNGATDKFIGRFRKVEEEAARQGRALEGMSLAELDKLWEHAKET